MPDYPLDVSFVVTTYNQIRFTIQFFASLAQIMKGLTYEIIVVDNGSTDGTIPWVLSNTPGTMRGRALGQNTPKRVSLLHNPKPRALSLSWNMGVDAAVGRYVMVCNNDILFGERSVHQMIALADHDPMVGVVMPLCPLDLKDKEFEAYHDPFLIHPYKTENWAQDTLHNLYNMETWADQDKLPLTSSYLPEPYLKQGGFAFLLTRRAWEKIGRFDEDYIFTSEDWDYFSRLRRHFKLARANSAYIYHYEHQSLDKLTRTESLERFALNRFLLTEKREGNPEYISIILPTYNRLKTLYMSIDSVLNQSFPFWRLYIIDDGSPNWQEICDALWLRYHPHFARIGLFPRPKNEGVGAVRNYGLSICRGKYVAFLDSDDEWYSDHLAQHWQAHETGNYAMVYSESDFAWRNWNSRNGSFDITPTKHPTIEYWGDYDKDELVKKNYIQISAVTVLGDLARRLEFPVDKELICEDWEYCKAVADAGGIGRPVKKLARATCRYNFMASTPEQDNRMLLWAPVLRAGAPKDQGAIVVQTSSVSTPVCVVIATKDRPEMLNRAIISAGDCSMVVIDDGSKDPQAIKKITAKYQNVTLLRHSSSQGASAARNRAVEHTSSEWIQFLDDDDTLLPGWQSTIESRTNQCDVLVGLAYVPDGTGLTISKEIFTSQICVRRSTFNEVGGFDEAVSWAEEREMLKRLEKHGARIEYLEVPTVIRPQRGGSGDPTTAKVTRSRAAVPLRSRL